MFRYIIFCAGGDLKHIVMRHDRGLFSLLVVFDSMNLLNCFRKPYVNEHNVYP
jgi:enoyl-CoA hydratase/carnithine racemase